MSRPKGSKNKISDGDYEVTITCLGQKVVGSGPSVLSILQNLELRNVRGRTIMHVRHGDAVKDRVIMPQVVMRAFNTNGFTRAICIKQIASLFDGI